jgi:hypothetical protein
MSDNDNGMGEIPEDRRIAKRVPPVLEKMTLKFESGINRDTLIARDVEHIRGIMAEQGYYITPEVAFEIWSSISTERYNHRWQMPQQIVDFELFKMIYKHLVHMPDPGGPVEVLSGLAESAAAIVEEITAGKVGFVPEERRRLYEGAIKEAADAWGFTSAQFEEIIKKNEFGGYANSVIAKFFLSLSDFLNVLKAEYPDSTEEENFIRYMGKGYYAESMKPYVTRALQWAQNKEQTNG